MSGDATGEVTASSGLERLDGLSVCVVACHYKPESTGSAPYNSKLVETLVEAGATVEVVAGIPHYPQWEIQDRKYVRGFRWREEDGGATLTRVRHAVPRRPSLFGRARLESSFLATALPLVWASRADVVVAVTPLVGAMAAAQAGRRGRPTGVIVHDLTASAAQQSGTTGGRASELIGSAEYGLLRRASLVGVITADFAPTLIKHGVSPDRVVRLPIFTHVKQSTMSAADARRHLGWPENQVTVVHTGNMGMKQGLEHVVSAAGAASERGHAYQFVFVGDGGQRTHLRELSAKLDNVRFVDPVADSDYPTVLAAADVLLLHERPGYNESSLPSKLTSYSAAGRPIVAAVEGDGITSTLLDTYGAAVTVPSGDPLRLIEAIGRIHADADLRSATIAGAYRMAASEFSGDSGRQAFRAFVRTLAANA